MNYEFAKAIRVQRHHNYKWLYVGTQWYSFIVVVSLYILKISLKSSTSSVKYLAVFDHINNHQKAHKISLLTHIVATYDIENYSHVVFVVTTHIHTHTQTHTQAIQHTCICS